MPTACPALVRPSLAASNGPTLQMTPAAAGARDRPGLPSVLQGMHQMVPT